MNNCHGGKFAKLKNKWMNTIFMNGRTYKLMLLPVYQLCWCILSSSSYSKQFLYCRYSVLHFVHVDKNEISHLSSISCNNVNFPLCTKVYHMNASFVFFRNRIIRMYDHELRGLHTLRFPEDKIEKKYFC